MSTPHVLRLVEEMSERSPDAVALRFPLRGGHYAALTFGELRQRCDAYTRALLHAGIQPGTRTCLMVPPGPYLGPLAAALFRIGAVPVLVDPGIAKSAVRACLEEARPEAFLGIPRAHAARLLLGWGRRTVRLPVVVGPAQSLGYGPTLTRLCADAAHRELPADPQPPDAVALLAFTSGSTGPPKPVEYRHRHLIAQYGLVHDVLGLGQGEVGLSTLPPFSLGFAAMGLSVVQPDMDPVRPASADPAALAGAVERFGVTGMFASPVPLDRLARHCAARGRVLRSLRSVTCAGATLDPRTAERMRRCLPEDATLKSVYGATEALPLSAIESRELLGEARELSEQGHGSCVGRPLPGNIVRIIRVTDEAVSEWSDELLTAPGAVGEITVTGPSTSAVYAGRPEDTALAKIRDGEQVVHRMGDLGRFDEDGRLWFCGRKSQRVRTPGGDLFTEQVEPVANTAPGVRRSALVGVGPPGAQLPVLCVEPEQRRLLRRDARWRIVTEVLARFETYEHTRGVRQVLFLPRLPVDARHQSKIDRGFLAEWAERNLRRKRGVRL